MSNFNSDTPETVLEVVNPDPRPDVVKRNEALVAKAEFERLIRGATVRADLLGRTHLSSLGFAVADLMLMQIVTGRLKPRTAKEAIEIAKAAQDIARKETGESDTSITITTPEHRENALARIAEIRAAAQNQQALEAGQPVFPTPGVPLDDDASIVDAELVEGASIPPSARLLAELRTIRVDGIPNRGE